VSGGASRSSAAASLVVAEVRRRGQLTKAEALLVAGGSPELAGEAVERAASRLAVVGDLLVDRRQARLAERRVLEALRRVHRQEPLVADVRVDALLARLREARSDPRPASHRGAQRLQLDDLALRAVVDAMVADGRLARRGHRVRLTDHHPRLGAVMRQRADELLAELRAAGVSPPRADAVASRLGVPEAVLAYLRSSGELVSVAPEIDYPQDSYAELTVRVRRIPPPRTVAQVRDAIGGSRRYAAALLAAVEGKPEG
jgi:hypothetical protein